MSILSLYLIKRKVNPVRNFREATNLVGIILNCNQTETDLRGIISNGVKELKKCGSGKDDFPSTSFRMVRLSNHKFFFALHSEALAKDVAAIFGLFLVNSARRIVIRCFLTYE